MCHAGILFIPEDKRRKMTSFGTLCWFAFVAMIIGFNVFVGNTILEIRRDIQMIRKRLGAEGKKRSKDATSTTKKRKAGAGTEAEATAKGDDSDSDTDSEEEEEEEEQNKKKN